MNEKVQITIKASTVVKIVVVGSAALTAMKVVDLTVSKLFVPRITRWTNRLNAKTEALREARDAEKGPWSEATLDGALKNAGTKITEETA